MKYLKKFENHTQYENYINGSGATLPNVSICATEGDVHYNPYVEPIETRVVAKYNVTDTVNPINIGYNQWISGFSAIEIDGIEQQSVVSAYTFNTTGEHTVKYTLTDQTSIGERAFASCSGLTSVDIPDSVTSIGHHAFASCSSLTSITIPNSVTSIGYDAFWYCRGLTSCTIGSGVTSIDDWAFYHCTSLTSIDIPNSVTSIGNSAFGGCSSLTSIDIPNSVTTIGGSVFQYCSGLTSCTIGSGVTMISGNTFASCSSLTSIVIPNSVTSICDYAFNECSGLTSIVCNATTAPTIDDYTFRKVKTGGTLTVPSGSSGYDVWMGTGNFYLGKYGWTKVEQ